MSAIHPALFEKINALPSDRIAEIEDFVEFLSERERGRALSRIALTASAPTFNRIWSNPDDDIYDNI